MLRQLKNSFAELTRTVCTNRGLRRHRRSRHSAAGIECLEVRSLLTGNTIALVSELPITHYSDSEGSQIDVSNITHDSDDASSAVYPLTAIPLLHSNPDATAKLFLDFDGNFESRWRNYNDITSPAFSMDSDATTFSDWELATLQEVWARVAEDFAPFNLDVTTEEPADFNDGHALHVVIGGSPYDWYGSSVGGVGPIGGFHNSQPNTVFVFSDFQFPQRNRAEAIANTASHEAGHAFGLEHQQEFDENGNVVNCYRHGNDQVGPLMGSAEASERGVWVYGPSESASDFVDEMAILSGSENGFGYRADDHGNAIEQASQLTRSGLLWTGEGIISQQTDSDVFRFHTDGGRAVFTISPSALGANLIVSAELRSVDNTAITSSEDTGTGRTILQAHLPEGHYVVIVRSNGEYGSLGQYSICGSVSDQMQSLPITPTEFRATSEYGFRHHLHWNTSDNATGYRVYRRSSPTGQELLMETLPAGVNSTTIVVPQYPIQTRDDRWFTQYRIEAFNEAGSATSTWQWTQHEFHTPRTMSTPQVRIVSATSVQLTWVASPDVQSQRMTVMQYISQNSFFYERFAWLSADASSLTLDRLIPGQRYAFSISGVNPAGIRATSVQFTMPGLSSPTVPTNLTATTNSPTTAILTWQDSDNETEYRVYRLQGSERSLIGTISADSTQLTATGLVPRTPYQFVVEALNELAAATATSNTVTPITIDIHGDTRSTATVLAAPATISTTIDHSGDVDTFSWRVTAGATYVFATTLSSEPGALQDSVIELLDSNGRRLAYNDDFGGTLASQLTWTAPQTMDGQQVFLSVRGYVPAQTGDYTLTASVTLPPLDDHGDTISSATEISAPSTLNAALQRTSDMDVFSLRAVAGTTYVFSTSLGNQSGSLRDSVIELLDSQGRRLGFNDDFGGTLASRLAWTAPQSINGQPVFLSVRGYTPTQTGTYSVSVTRTGPSAPVVSWSEQTAIAATIAIGGQTTDQISAGGARNLYRLNAESGQRIAVYTQLLSLRDSVITIYNSLGQRIAFNDDYGRSLASRIELTATQRETWFIEVRAFAATQLGTFRLLVTEFY